MTRSLYDALVQDTLRFGLNGSQTLEYLGLITRGGVLQSTKVYHTTKQAPAALQDWQQALYVEWLQRLERYDGKICDFSAAGTEQAPTYRMIMMFRNGLSLEQAQAITAEEFPGVPPEITSRCYACNLLVAKAIASDASPMIQIGIELDAQMRFRSLKYYLSVKELRPVWQQFPERIAPLLSELGISPDQRDSLETAARIGEQWYSPLFIGINDAGTEIEAKLYFISDLFGRSLSTKPAEQISRVCEVLQISSGVSEAMLAAWEQVHIYPEGVAVSFDHAAVIRFYLKELPAAYFRTVKQENRPPRV